MVEVCFLLRKVLISSTLLSQFNSNTNYQNLGRIYTSINSLDHSNIHHTVGVFPFYHPVDFKSMSITFYVKKIMTNKYDYLLVGAGLFSTCFAYRAKQAGKKCLVIDKRPQLGGNVYCDNIEGINVHKYGAHIFHTSNKQVWDFVNSIVEFNRYTNCPIANYKGKLFNLPFNMNTFYQLWGVKTPAEAKEKIEEQRREFAHITEPANLEEQALKLCGKDIYRCLIKGYTEKQWGRAATELPAFIIRRIPFRFVYDNNYFNDAYQGIPKGGYNVLIDALLEGIDVRPDTNYFEHREELNALADKVLFTGCIDEYFDFCCGRLEYRSLRFDHQLLDTEDFQGNAVVNYTEREVPYTRIIEHKHFEYGTQPVTVITYEYPDDFQPGKEPYYPVNDKRNTEIYQKYKELAQQLPNVLFGGRLAQYTYADMDDTVNAALTLWRKQTRN